MYWCSSSASARAEAWSWPNGFSTTTRASCVTPPRQAADDGAEQERRDLEVEDGGLRALDGLRDLSVGCVVREVSVVVREPLREPGDPNVGEQADAGLGHGEPVALAGDPVGAVERDADAGPHHHPVDQRDGGLHEALELPVERVFGRQRLDRVRPAELAPFRQFADVPAGAEGPVGGGANYHGVNLRIARPGGERGGHGCAHVRIERVERRRPIQGDQACRVVLPQDDVGRRISRRALTCICSRFPVFHWFFFHRLFPIFAINFWILTLATISGYI